MFSTVNHFQMFKPGSVIFGHGALQIQTREPIKSTNDNSIKRYWTAWTGNDKRRNCAHQKHAEQQNEYYSTFTAEAFYRKYSDVIINIFISNCNLITHPFLVTITDYNYIYLVNKLRNFITCNLLLPNTAF